ncbi:MAG: hypothetical protein KA210_02150 [Bacteroidia bacterium]|jgi:hypothetical protein|nr:hypothetical protein [Bacteroidia bacterium]
MNKNENKKSILEGHKKVGKKFIPPIVQYEGFREINWGNDIIPELIWIAVIQKKLGYKMANEAISELHKHYLEICDTKYINSLFSSYDSISKEAKAKLKDQFSLNQYFDQIFEGLKDLQYYFPNHPLQFLYDDRIIQKSEVNIQLIKDSIKGILERRSEAGTIAQAAVLFNSMVSGKFNAPYGSIFWEFEEIDNYPKTEKSLQLASSIRAMINAFMDKETRNVECEWVNSFWQRSFQLEPPFLKLNR